MRKNIHLKRCCPLKDANETFTLTPLGCRMFELCVKKPDHISLFKKKLPITGWCFKAPLFFAAKTGWYYGVGTPLEVMVRIVVVCFPETESTEITKTAKFRCLEIWKMYSNKINDLSAKNQMNGRLVGNG